MQEPKNPSIFKRGDIEAPKIFSAESYLDVKGYASEQDALIKSAKKLREGLTPFIKFTDNRSIKQWNDLISRPDNLYKSMGAIANNLNSSTLKDTVIGGNIECVLRAATHLLSLESIQKLMNLAKKCNFYNYSFQQYGDFINFGTTGDLFMKIDGVSLLDLFQKKDLSLSEYYDCMINAWIIKNQSNYDETFTKNSNNFTNLYPNSSKQLIFESCGQIISTTDFTSQDFTSHLAKLPSSDGLGKEIVAKAQDMIQSIDALDQELLDAIFDPNSSNFLQLKQRVELYLDNEDVNVKKLAIGRLGIKTIGNAVDGYRKAKKLSSEDNEHKAFYVRMTNSIKKFIFEDSPRKFNKFTCSDVPMFTNNHEANDMPTLDMLRNIKMKINQKSSKTKYSLDPFSIEWQGLIQPVIAVVNFNQDSPDKIDIAFYYKSDRDKDIELFFEVDTKKGKIEWDFLEDPEDPEMKNMKKALLLSTKSLLLEIQKQAEIEYLKKQPKEKINTSLPLRETKTTNSNHMPQKTKKNHPTVSLDDRKLSEGKNEIKRRIAFSNNINEEKIMKHLPLENQIEIKKAIDDFNERGVGIFKPLTNNIKHGGKKPVYELKVRSFRVLVTMADSSNGKGVANFLVYKIVQSEDVFQKKTKNYL